MPKPCYPTFLFPTHSFGLALTKLSKIANRKRLHTLIIAVLHSVGLKCVQIDLRLAAAAATVRTAPLSRIASHRIVHSTGFMFCRNSHNFSGGAPSSSNTSLHPNTQIAAARSPAARNAARNFDCVLTLCIHSTSTQSSDRLTVEVCHPRMLDHPGASMLVEAQHQHRG